MSSILTKLFYSNSDLEKAQRLYRIAGANDKVSNLIILIKCCLFLKFTMRQALLIWCKWCLTDSKHHGGGCTCYKGLFYTYRIVFSWPLSTTEIAVVVMMDSFVHTGEYFFLD